MSNMFDLFSDEFRDISFEPQLMNNAQDREFMKILRAERERSLSAFAVKSDETRGRIIPEEPCLIRSDYERDMGRIIFSQSFRRLRHKTQVFFNPSNDHICSRIEHVIYVNYISTIIGRALNLNVDLIQAIAMGHDIGHAPFGHTGERALNRCIKSVDPDMYFEHEVHGLRVLDILEEHNGSFGLNLTFEVRDGIVSHCGETYNEYVLTPCKDKTEAQISSKKEKDRTAPATLEGCVVRFADKIAYVGRDAEDARRAGIIGGSKDFLPTSVTDRLGSTNAETINILVGDIIHSSMNSNEIRMSEGNFKAMNDYLTHNLEDIYKAPKIMTYEKTVNIMIDAIFEAFMRSTEDIEKALHSENQTIKEFAKYYLTHPERDSVPVRRVIDYIAGMTDAYANSCFDALYRV